MYELAPSILSGTKCPVNRLKVGFFGSGRGMPLWSVAYRRYAIRMLKIAPGQYETQLDKQEPLINAVPLTQHATAQLLSDIIGSAENHRLVFDLDSTLLDNKPRNAVIMQEFASYRDEPRLANATAAHFQDWSARNSMLTIGLPASDVEPLLDDYWEFWSKRFFTSDYCQYDLAVSGAVDFLGSIEKAGGSICYLTGRHEGMRIGTEASLEKLGFPVPGTARVELRMKPREDQADDSFKVETLETLEGEMRVLAAFDNEPTHINSYRSAFPDAVCVHLLTDHSMREVKLLDNIVSIYDFL